MTTTTELSTDVVKQEYIDNLSALLKQTKEQLDEINAERKKASKEYNSRSSLLQGFKYYLEECADSTRPVAFLDAESHAAYVKEIKEKSKTKKELEEKSIQCDWGIDEIFN